MLASKYPFIFVIGDKGALCVPPPSLSMPFHTNGHNENSANDVLQILAAHPKHPVLILADTMAMDFKHASLPRLWPWDRKKLLARRLKEFFPESYLSAAFDSGKGNMLFSSLPLQHQAATELKSINTSSVSPIRFWYEKFSLIKNDFWGVSLLPVESADMVRVLDRRTRKTNWVLLLTWQRTGGFRQIVLKNGNFIFTRLTPPLSFIDPTPAYIAAALSLDLQSTRDYLARAGLSKDTPLHMIAILPERLHASLSTSLLPVQTKELLTPLEAAQRLSLSHAPMPNDDNCDIVHAYWAMRTCHLNRRLATDDTLQKLTDKSVKKLGYCCALILWFLLFAFLGTEGFQLFQENTLIQKNEQEISDLQSTLSRIQHDLSPITEPLGRLRLALERKRIFQPNSLPPLDLAQIFSESLGDQERLILWEWDNNPETKEPETLHVTLRLVEPGYSKMSPEAQRSFSTTVYKDIQLRLAEKLSNYNYIIQSARLPFSTDPNDALTNGIKIEDVGRAEFEIIRGEQK